MFNVEFTQQSCVFLYNRMNKINTEIKSDKYTFDTANIQRLTDFVTYLTNQSGQIIQIYGTINSRHYN